MLVKTRAIVMHYVKYGDHSIIIHLYTKTYGKQSYIASNVHGKRAKLPLGMFHPLSLLEIEAYVKDTRDIQRIKEASQINQTQAISPDYIINTLKIFIAEILYRTIKEHESNIELFHFLEKTIADLESNPKGISNFHLCFLVHYSKYLGIYSPSISSDLIVQTPSGKTEKNWLNKVESSYTFLTQHVFTDLDKLSISRDIKNLLLDYLVDYYYYHLEGMGKIKSLKILRELMV